MRCFVMILLTLLFSANAVIAAEGPKLDRQETITYINKILEQLNGTKVGYMTTEVGTFDHSFDYLTPLIYEGSYTFQRRSRVGPYRLKYSNAWFIKIFKANNVPIKEINRISRNEHRDTDKEHTLSTVGAICLHFNVPVRFVITSYAEGAGRLTPDELFEGTESKLCIIYPAEDPKNFTRLQNAFLRLKEIESEVRDPFLD